MLVPALSEYARQAPFSVSTVFTHHSSQLSRASAICTRPAPVSSISPASKSNRGDMPQAAALPAPVASAGTSKPFLPMPSPPSYVTQPSTTALPSAQAASTSAPATSAGSPSGVYRAELSAR